jgi:hypothetical protein
MKLMKKILPICIIMVCLSAPTLLHAQPVDPCTDPFLDCPIDDGVIYLIGAVLAIAAYKFISLTKKVAA